MRRLRQSRRQDRPGRQGFTLMELLIVIAIILILLSLTAAATMRLMGGQQHRNTVNTLTKVSDILNSQWKLVIDQATREQIPEPFNTSTLLPLANNDPRRARVIWIKLRLKQQFPMNYFEVQNPTPSAPVPMAAVPTYQEALNQAYQQATNLIGIPAARVVQPATASPGSLSFDETSTFNLRAQNSACLLLALSQARSGPGLNPDSLGSNVLADTDSDGLREIVDAWGTPIVFYRWPWGNPDVDAQNPARSGSAQQNIRDPGDPEGKLLDQSWWTGLGPPPSPGRNITNFEQMLHLVSTPIPNNPTGGAFPSSGPYNLTGPISYFMVPVVASAGPDMQFGLDSIVMGPDPTVNYVTNPPVTDNYLFPPAATDNIYSYRLRLGSSGQ